MYAKFDSKLNTLKRGSTTKSAIVIHLYYPDLWPVFNEKLKLLNDINFDLFITIPKNLENSVDCIFEDFRSAIICVVPNLGRDVLPFIKVSKHLIRLGYENVLKIHSKKSTHRDDGSQWLMDIIDPIVPKDKKLLYQIIKTLDDPNTSIIGPAGQYISLPVNFDANSRQILSLIEDLFDKKTRDMISDERSEYGFFAGTMFWARLDSISSVIARKYKVSDFDMEGGQIDGTLPHALERVFTLNAELNGKNIFEVDDKGIRKLKYKTDNIPEWSELYIGPK